MMSLTFGLFNQVSGLGPLGPLVSHKTSIFHYRNIFGNMLCLPVFPAGEIDNPLCLVCVQ